MESPSNTSRGEVKGTETPVNPSPARHVLRIGVVATIAGILGAGLILLGAWLCGAF